MILYNTKKTAVLLKLVFLKDFLVLNKEIIMHNYAGEPLFVKVHELGCVGLLNNHLILNSGYVYEIV